MRVNIYAEEMTDRVEIVEKTINGQTFTGVRFYMYMPVTTRDGVQHQGPFIHRKENSELPHDDDSSAVTFWGKGDLKRILQKGLEVLQKHHYEKNKQAKLGA